MSSINRIKCCSHFVNHTQNLSNVCGPTAGCTSNTRPFQLASLQDLSLLVSSTVSYSPSSHLKFVRLKPLVSSVALHPPPPTPSLLPLSYKVSLQGTSPLVFSSATSPLHPSLSLSLLHAIPVRPKTPGFLFSPSLSSKLVSLVPSQASWFLLRPPLSSKPSLSGSINNTLPINVVFRSKRKDKKREIEVSTLRRFQRGAT